MVWLDIPKYILVYEGIATIVTLAVGYWWGYTDCKMRLNDKRRKE